MRRHTCIVAVLAAVTTAAATATALGLAATGASAGAQHGTAHAAATAAPAVPKHVYAPYFESWEPTGPATLSQESGAKFLSMAFLQTATAGSCTAYWNGDTSEPIASSSFGSDIAAIQAAGGNVIPSFGGYTADTTGTDIADSCTDVASIAKVYESLVTTYHVTRIDLDVEADSVNNTAGVNRRNEAIAQVESWAAANGHKVQFSYTLPVTTTGLPPAEQAVIANAIANNAKITVVNAMTFDYYIGTKQNMVADTRAALKDTHSQLQALYPGDTSSQVWHMIGVTEMPGIDDFGADETFWKNSAPAVLNLADRKGLAMISIWALQRDNGGCPGTKGAGTCSGIHQPTWFFSHTFEPFTK
jgi:hypothetical protein